VVVAVVVQDGTLKVVLVDQVDLVGVVVLRDLHTLMIVETEILHLSLLHKEILVDSKKVELEEAEAVEQLHKVNLVETLQALTLDLKTKVVLVDLVLKLL
tara:strand:+ start:80 stop:379 length:300 start_codon:yes stop_codon:yes gene_type:complete